MVVVCCASVLSGLVDASESLEVGVVESYVDSIVVSSGPDDGADELSVEVADDAAEIVEVTIPLSLVDIDSALVMVSVPDVIDDEGLLSLESVEVVEITVDESDIVVIMGSVEVLLVSGPTELSDSPAVVAIVEAVNNELEL